MISLRKVVIAFVVTIGACAFRALAATPNIVFILIYDMGWRDLGCYGSTFYETPNIDRLATQGMRFTNAYAACPVCSPTRASILTGQYPARVGVTNFIGGHSKGKLLEAPYIDHLPAEEINLAKVLRGGGYQTWHIGKWHLGGKEFWPEKQGFDVNIAGSGIGHQPTCFSPYRIANLTDGPDGEYLTDRLTDEAIGLIRKRDKGRPFYLNFCHYAVHTPIQAPAALVEKYKAKAHRLGLDQIDPMSVGEPFPMEEKKDKHVTRRRFQSDPVYAAMIENLDSNVGRLMAELESQAIAGDTIVIFTSDNGGLATAEGSPTSNVPLSEGKGWMYDGGVREPLIVRWPATIRAGAVSDVVMTSPDFYPTLLEAASLAIPAEQKVDGISFMPALKGQLFERGPIFWHYPHYGNQGGAPGSSIRWGDWKLIEFFETGKIELYNLKTDVSESTNRGGDQSALARKLHGELIAWRQSVGAVMPTTNPGFKP